MNEENFTGQEQGSPGERHIFKKRDGIIIVLALAAAAAVFVLLRLFPPQGLPGSPTQPSATGGSSGGDYVYVYVGNDLYEAAPLNEDALIEIDQGDGRINHVRIYGGQVYMESSTCENQDCVEQGKISPENYEQRPMRNWVVCLPNQVSIELHLESEEGQ